MWKTLCLSLSAALIGLILSEVTINVAELAPEVAVLSVGRFRLSSNPQIGYEPIPNLDIGRKLQWFDDFKGKSNNLGFRDQNHGVTKPEGVFRILVLGDSIAMGLGIRKSEDIFSEVLERTLREEHERNVEVINFGVSGYNTMQEVAMLEEKGLQFNPDLVLLQYCVNDRGRMDGTILASLNKRAEQSDGTWSARALHKSGVYRFLRYRVFAEKPGRLTEVNESGVLYADTVARSFEHLSLLADKNGFQVFVVGFPDRKFLSEDLNKIAKLSRRLRFHYLDLSQTFKSCSGRSKPSIWLDSIHPNRLGTLCAGRAIAGFVIRQKLTDPRPDVPQLNR